MMEIASEWAEPGFGDPVPACQPSPDARRLLGLRRSTSVELLGEPGPDADTLRSMLRIASRVPDHRKLVPFRFLVVQGEARVRAGEGLGIAFREREKAATPEQIAVERARFLRTPTVIAVIARIDRNHRTPEWEQTLTCGAVCQTLLLAASAHGFGAQWLTEWYAYDANVSAWFGLSGDETFAGFVYIGTALGEPRERQRPVLDDIVSFL